MLEKGPKLAFNLSLELYLFAVTDNDIDSNGILCITQIVRYLSIKLNRTVLSGLLEILVCYQINNGSSLEDKQHDHEIINGMILEGDDRNSY